MRWHRRPDFDDQPTPTPPFRSEELRALIDRLEGDERHMVERTYFGGEGVAEAGREIGLTAKQASDLRARAVARVRRTVLEDHRLRSVLAAQADRI